MAFQLAQLAFWLMAAPHGYAKNYSIFLRQGNTYEMTPLYDVLSVWPYVGRSRGQWRLRDLRLAMALCSKSAHYEIHPLRACHWHGLAMKNGAPRVWGAMQGLVESVAQALNDAEAQLPQDFPLRLWEPISRDPEQ